MAATIEAPPRKTLLEWIEDDGNTTSDTQPECSETVRAFHARIAFTDGSDGGTPEPLAPPQGLALVPLG